MWGEVSFSHRLEVSLQYSFDDNTLVSWETPECILNTLSYEHNLTDLKSIRNNYSIMLWNV